MGTIVKLKQWLFSISVDMPLYLHISHSSKNAQPPFHPPSPYGRLLQTSRTKNFPHFVHNFNSIYSMNWRFNIVLFHLKWHPFDQQMSTLIFCIKRLCHCYLVCFSLASMGQFLASLSLFIATIWFALAWRNAPNVKYSLVLAAIKISHQ